MEAVLRGYGSASGWGGTTWPRCENGSRKEPRCPMPSEPGAWESSQLRELRAELRADPALATQAELLCGNTGASTTPSGTALGQPTQWPSPPAKAAFHGP